MYFRWFDDPAAALALVFGIGAVSVLALTL
jgi:hypothetical protein